MCRNLISQKIFCKRLFLIQSSYSPLRYLCIIIKILPVVQARQKEQQPEDSGESYALKIKQSTEEIKVTVGILEQLSCKRMTRNVADGTKLSLRVWP